MRIIGNTDIGKVRAQNQDAFWTHQFDDGSTLAVVCDGMGGANGGQQASMLAVQMLRLYVKQCSEFNNVQATFEEIIQVSNKKVYIEAYDNPELSGMGTTMVMAYTKEGKTYFANVGDSRGYYITNGSIRQITKDHSAVQELVDSGHLTERQAKLHPNKNIITRAVGIEENIAFDFFEVDVAPGDIILLCSDGLTNHVDENEIQFEASGGDFDQLPTRLIDLANSRGGSDNITVVAVQI